MRIIFQYYSGGGGGLANFVMLLQAYLRRFREDHITIVCSKSSALRSLASEPNVDFVILGEWRFKELVRFWLGCMGLNAIAKRNRADVVWSLNLGSYVRGGIPSIISLNNPHQIYPQEATTTHPGGGVRVFLLRSFFRLSARAANGIVVQTPLMARYVRDRCGENYPVAVIPKAVEADRDVCFKPLTASILRRLERVSGSVESNWLYVATSIPHKNHTVIIRAFEVLRRRGRKFRLVLTIDEERAIHWGGEVARDLICDGALVALGWVSKEHLRALYAECDACVMPSVLESLSSAHLEAMEWGLPQVAADLPYARDLCGDAAIYVNPHDAEEWALAVERLAEDESLRKLIVAEGRKRMDAFPSGWAECAERVRLFLQSVKSAN